MDHDRQTKELISASELSIEIDNLAAQIKVDYTNKEVVLAGVLKGSYIFLADLSRSLWQQGLKDFEVDFLGISSYGKDTESSKNPQITKDLSIDIRNRHVLIVEDIVDTGYSLEALRGLLGQRHPLSLKTVVLLSKTNRREIKVPVEYIGFEVSGWVEGYGLDSDEKYRGRPNIVEIINSDN